VSKVISMTDRSGASSMRITGIRDRRYTTRYPFAADAELIDMETGKSYEGVTSDISFGGCFICTSKPLAVNARARLILSRRGQTLEALVVVRIVKPRVGMGIEFFNLEPPYNDILASWMDILRRAR
jgi:PilZ domain